MDIPGKATKIRLFDFSTPQMRAFHMSWFSFFLCFFAWFGIAPLMPTVREEMGLRPWQIGNLIVASVAVTILSRLFIGWLCDRIGPRLSYSALLIVGSLPVMTIGFAQSYESLFWFRLAIGAIGASFVITQYHTSLMFAPNCVGTANATSAGWGNLGGGVTQKVMPSLAAGLTVHCGLSVYYGWRIAMLIAGVVCFLTGIAYYFWTQDTPLGNFKELREEGKMPKAKAANGAFWQACGDHRVWALFLIYGACFGIELTINNIAVLYYFDTFAVSQQSAGLIAAMFGLMNIFARTLGGAFGDRFGDRWGLKGRVTWLFAVLFCEGIALMWFSQMQVISAAIVTMVVFSLFVQMAEGATFAVVPFVNRRALGAVSGIVGAGGNVGAVTAGFLFKTSTERWPTALLILGASVTLISFAAFAVQFSPEAESAAEEELAAARNAVPA